MDSYREKILESCEQAQAMLRADGGQPKARIEKIVQQIRRAKHAPVLYARYFLARAGILGSADTTVATFWGEPMVVPLSDGDATGVTFFGILAGPEYKLIRYFIRSLPSDAIFYDIGANHGFYSMLAQKLAREGEVHAFEPLPSAWAYVVRNTKATTVINSALSDASGTVSMFDMTGVGHSGGSTIEKAVGERMSGAARVNVAAITLDEYCATHTPPTIMKIDVEGGEHRVLEGGRETIARYEPVIAMEVWGGEKGKRFSAPALEKLEMLGYAGYLIQEDGTLSRARRPTEYIGILEADNLIFKRG